MEQSFSWDFSNKNTLCLREEKNRAEQHMPENFSILNLIDNNKDEPLSFDDIQEFFQFANRDDKNNSVKDIDDNDEIVTEMISFEEIKKYIASGKLTP